MVVGVDNDNTIIDVDWQHVSILSWLHAKAVCGSCCCLMACSAAVLISVMLVGGPASPLSHLKQAI